MKDGEWIFGPLLFFLGLAMGFLLFIGVSKAEWAKVAAEWPGITDTQRQWFKKQKDPRGNYCCDDADGHPALWDIREGHYWANWDGGWHQIPDDKVIENSDPAIDTAVLWLSPAHMYDGGKDLGYRYVRCFRPGPGA